MFIFRWSDLTWPDLTWPPECYPLIYYFIPFNLLTIYIQLLILTILHPDVLTAFYICRHPISNLQFYQKWIAGSIHYHIPLCALLQSHKSGLCDSFSQTSCKPEVVFWHHYLVMALLCWCLEGWVSTKGWPISVIFKLECCEHKEVQ